VSVFDLAKTETFICHKFGAPEAARFLRNFSNLECHPSEEYVFKKNFMIMIIQATPSLMKRTSLSLSLSLRTFPIRGLRGSNTASEFLQSDPNFMARVD
jgi:hypothetical protein